MLIIKNAKDIKKVNETAKEFNGEAYEINGSIQIEFDSDFAHMELPLMNELMNQGEKVSQA